MSLLGICHTICGVLSLLLGGWIFIAAKGTRTHIRAGWAYVACMTILNVSGLAIRNLTGGFNIFHALAALSLTMIVIGIVQVRNRRRWSAWMRRHYLYMAWSYVGLLAATCNEAFVRIPALERLSAQTGPALPLVGTFIVLAISYVFISAFQKSTLHRYGGERPDVTGSPPAATG